MTPPPGISPEAALGFLTVPLSTGVVFPALAGAALYWRQNAAVHKRLMLIAALELLPAGLARVPGMLPFGPLGFFGGTDVFLLAIAIYDVATRRRLHIATLLGGLFLVASQVGRIMLSSTEAWLSFARWFIS